MKEILDFLLKVNKLKKMPRRGWVLRGIKNPETLAEHSFRLAILAWLLGSKKEKMDMERVLKIALFHELSKVFIPDATPYDSVIYQQKRISKEIFKEFPVGFKKEKEKIFYRDFNKEYKSLKKLTQKLPSSLEKELIDSWKDYSKAGSREGRFVRQVYRIENLLQAMEYWEKDKSFPIEPFWLEAELFVEDPILIQFLKVVEKEFYSKTKNPETNFLLQVGKLKTFPRKGWVLRKVKNPETIAAHSFFVGIMTWCLAKKFHGQREKILKMALCHEICEVYAKDQTPYERILPQSPKKVGEILQQWPRFLQKEKIKNFLIDFQTEKRALKKLLRNLAPEFRNEIFQLWEEFKTKKTREGNFVNQAYWVSTFLQAVQYWKEDKNFPIQPWWEQIIEFIDDHLLFELVVKIKEKFKLKITS